MNNTYKSAGVDKEEGYKTVDKIKKAVAETHNPNVLNSLGSFGAFYEIGGYKNPVLVSGTDGVGTKLKVALDTKQYGSIGIDCFAMCANDILCHGAKPLFFLDYLACGKLDSDIAAEIVLGMVKACKDNQCALIGGETAEMPGMYQPGDYDVAGFCVGIVEKDEIIDGSKIQKGDKIIALPSSGFHSNGFSLVRKVFTDFNEVFDGKPLHETLLVPTRLYYQPIHKLLKEVSLHGIAHITGGLHQHWGNPHSKHNARAREEGQYQPNGDVRNLQYGRGNDCCRERSRHRESPQPLRRRLPHWRNHRKLRENSLSIAHKHLFINYKAQAK